jgi:hypothetical protein
MRAHEQYLVAAGLSMGRPWLESLCHQEKSVARASVAAIANDKLWKQPHKP